MEADKTGDERELDPAEVLEEDEDDGDYSTGSDSDKMSSESTPVHKEFAQPRLKIKLKLPSHPSPSSAASTPNPDDRHGALRAARSLDVESEDEEEDDAEGNSRSTPSTVAGPSTRPMTARQAVLASVGDSPHVSLPPSEPLRKKKLLNDAELVLRREETARKRRNLTEKRLEDEKAETINRLLKKQSRQRNKRAANLLSMGELPMPSATATMTPDPEGLEHVGEEVERPEEPAVPKMFRWVSSVRTSDDGKEGEEKKRRSVIVFAAPVSIVAGACGVSDGTQGPNEPRSRSPASRSSQLPCDVSGCGRVRKYRLTSDPRKGACGMQHLKCLETLPVDAM